MKGDNKVIEFLNEALKNELTAINQYWLHYRLLDNMGVTKLAELERHFIQRQSFAFETTLSGRAYAHAIRRWQSAGYKVELIFLKLHDAEEAIARVEQRVLQGGHYIPDEVVRRRFEQGLKNLVQIYQPLVNAWAVYDNSGEAPQLIDWSEK